MTTKLPELPPPNEPLSGLESQESAESAESPGLFSSIGTMRTEYRKAHAQPFEADLFPAAGSADPFAHFARWFRDAVAAAVPEPNGMTLATSTPDGKPSARIVLLKGFGPAGFGFFTNYESRKGLELADNARAALVFWWQALERQVRIEGVAEKISVEESALYFHSRPLGSRIGAWASAQSRPIAGRASLEARVRELELAFADGNVPLPPYWGGYRVVPERLEFWQGQPSRLHDRLVYERSAEGWRIERLSP